MHYITYDNLSDEIKIKNSHFISLSYNVENSKEVKKKYLKYRFVFQMQIIYAMLIESVILNN